MQTAEAVDEVSGLSDLRQGQKKTVTEHRKTRAEVLLVLGVSLGYSAVYALVDLAGKLTAGKGLSSQTTTLNPSQAAGHPWLDLALQLVQIFFGVVPALLALHLLKRDKRQSRMGFQPPRVAWDAGTGAVLAVVIGIPGLALYVASHAIGINTTVVPEALPFLWWTVPVLLLSAFQNAFLEEVVVVGYLTIRLREMSWSVPAVVGASALLRGAYHLYQGFGGFIGNAVMGMVFALFFLRFKRVGPLVLAHTILDSAAFVGYALFGGSLTTLGL